MSKGNEIIVSAGRQGKYYEGIVSGTPKPGTIMEIKAAVAPVNGKFTWQATTKADGAKQLIAILCGDDLQGKLSIGAALTFPASGGAGGGSGFAPGDAYVSGTRCFLYMPIAGEELNVLVASVSGTADDVAIGDLLGPEQTTGKVKANNSFGNPCFTSLEAVTDPTADYMLWVMFNG